MMMTSNDSTIKVVTKHNRECEKGQNCIRYT